MQLLARENAGLREIATRVGSLEQQTRAQEDTIREQEQKIRELTDENERLRGDVEKYR